MKLSNFQVIKPLGEGGFGSVVMAKWKESTSAEIAKNQLVAIKMINNSHQNSIKREVQILKMVKGQFFLSQFINSFQDLTTAFIVLRYEENGTLLDFINRQSKIVLDVAQKIVVEIVLGLQYLHAQNFIHCDIKPENIFLDTNLRSHVGDFGLSVPVHESKYYGKWGTSVYQSPEQLREKEPWDQRTDYFNVGLIFVMMLIGEHPFNKDTRSDTDIEKNIVALNVKYPNINEPTAVSFIKNTLCYQKDRLNAQNVVMHPFIAPNILKIVSSYTFKTVTMCDENKNEDVSNFPNLINGIEFNQSILKCETGGPANNPTIDVSTNSNDQTIIEKLRNQMGEAGKNCVVMKNHENNFIIKCNVCQCDLQATSQIQIQIQNRKPNWQAQPFLRHIKTKKHLKTLALRK